MNNYKNPNAQIREAYNRTLKGAELRGSASFCCGPVYNGATYAYVVCRECPLNHVGCGDKHDVKYWRQWWKELTGEEDEGDNDLDLLKKADTDSAPEDALDSVPHMATLEEAKDILDSQLAEIDDAVNPKFKMVYNLLDQPGEHKIESADLSIVLFTLNLWYKEAIKWNLIANGSTSDIPSDFKDIYFRLYDSGGNLTLVNTYTLKSVGLTKQWVRNDNIDKNKG